MSAITPNESDFQSKHTNNKAMDQTDLRTPARLAFAGSYESLHSRRSCAKLPRRNENRSASSSSTSRYESMSAWTSRWKAANLGPTVLAYRLSRSSPRGAQARRRQRLLLRPWHPSSDANPITTPHGTAAALLQIIDHIIGSSALETPKNEVYRNRPTERQ